jgi:hypothetical protein
MKHKVKICVSLQENLKTSENSVKNLSEFTDSSYKIITVKYRESISSRHPLILLNNVIYAGKTLGNTLETGGMVHLAECLSSKAKRKNKKERN